MIKEILLTLFYIILFNFLIYRFKKLQIKNFRPSITILLFNLKFLTGIFIWVVYTFYYKDVQNNDVHKFYNDALVLNQIAYENPKVFLQLMVNDDGAWKEYTAPMRNWNRNFDEAPFNENRTVIRLNALLMFFSLKTYCVHILFFCFFSLLGWILLTNSILSFVDKRNTILTLPVLFLPSVLFWTSGVMKEPLVILGLGLLFYGILDCELRITKVVAILAGIMTVLFTKFFVIVCLFPAAIAFFLFRSNENRDFILLKYLVVGALFLLMAFSFHHLIPHIDWQQILINKQTHSIKEAEYFNAGSRIEIPALEKSFVSVLKTSVIGVWNTLLRPYVSETKNIMMLMSAIENVIVITFLIMFITCSKWRQPFNLNLFLFLFAFSLAYFAVIGMCTPVLGNLVRYKTPLLPIFMFAFILQVDPKAVADSLSFVLRKTD